VSRFVLLFWIKPTLIQFRASQALSETPDSFSSSSSSTSASWVFGRSKGPELSLQTRCTFSIPLLSGTNDFRSKTSHLLLSDLSQGPRKDASDDCSHLDAPEAEPLRRTDTTTYVRLCSSRSSHGDQKLTSLFPSTSPSIEKVLIVCPVSLTSNWKKEFSKWFVCFEISSFLLCLNIVRPRNFNSYGLHDLGSVETQSASFSATATRTISSSSTTQGSTACSSSATKRCCRFPLMRFFLVASLNHGSCSTSAPYRHRRPRELPTADRSDRVRRGYVELFSQFDLPFTDSCSSSLLRAST
jgi:hypothetical protein